MINIKGKLEFGNREQIDAIKEEQNREFWSHWVIIVTDNFGYETKINTYENIAGCVCKNDSEAICFAKQ